MLARGGGAAHLRRVRLRRALLMCRTPRPPFPPPRACPPCRQVTHPEYGTAMRMLLQEVPLRIAAEGDKTWSGLLGPLRDP